MSPDILLHVAERAEYEAARSAGATHYAPGAFEAEGFVHLCRPDQLAGVLQRYYRNREDLLLLHLDAAAFDAELRMEDGTGRGERFPHLYGPVPLRAVREVWPFGTDAAGAPLAVAQGPQFVAAAFGPAPS